MNRGDPKNAAEMMKVENNTGSGIETQGALMNNGTNIQNSDLVADVGFIV